MHFISISLPFGRWTKAPKIPKQVALSFQVFNAAGLAARGSISTPHSELCATQRLKATCPPAQQSGRSVPDAVSVGGLMPRLTTQRGRHTSPLVWLAAVVCAFLSVAVIVAGAVVFAVYMVYQPRMPYIRVSFASLNKLQYDQSGLLDLEMALTFVAVNGNGRSHASFADESFLLRFGGIDVAVLRADPFDVPKNSSFALGYVVPSSTIPLDERAMDVMDAALKQGRVPFQLTGHARTRWRVGVFFSARFWTHLSCPLYFFWPNGSAIALDCSSKSH